jgi:alpha-amylase
MLLLGCGSGGSGAGTTAPPPLPQTYTPTGRALSGDVFVHLFEWRWADIARECETWLGPRGFKAVQISPPSEHAVFSGAPWWQRYQTVSYRLDLSRSGTQAELVDMVNRCAAVGVDIYADVVINHMTAGSGVGSAGDSYTKYSYPAVPWVASDFHATCSIGSYNNAFQVQNCELDGLADLATEQASVRQRISQYLIALNALGVAGFRVDAAKHMNPLDVDAIVALVNNAAVAAGRPLPYFFLEVINNPGEAVTAQQYFGVGYSSGGASDITDFIYGYRVSDAFLGRNGATLQTLQTLTSQLLPSDKSVVFTDNHDNQRAQNVYYADSVYRNAVIFELAHPQGYPALISSYGFDHATQAGLDAGPPSNPPGVTQSTYDTNDASLCTATLGSPQVNSWVCEHRVPAIANMVAFRKFAVGAPLSDCGRGTWSIDGDANRIAFCREGAGFVALSVSSSGATDTLPTHLPAGTYCDVSAGDYTPAGGATPATCSGPTVVVGAAPDGMATITLNAQGAVALHIGARL